MRHPLSYALKVTLSPAMIAGLFVTIPIAPSAAQSAAPRISYSSCVDPTGKRVIMVSSRRIRNVGLAGRKNGHPVIMMNPNILRRFHPITRAFWFYHECAHHKLGHTLGFRPMSRERDSDCWAIREMRRRGLLTSGRLIRIQQDLYSLSGDGILYLPGPERARHLNYCLRGKRPVRPSRATLSLLARRHAAYSTQSHRQRPRQYRRKRVLRPGSNLQR